jgi:adenylate cyclase
LSQGERRLAAIMFTDMVGYTALGQRNESLSLALVEEQRKVIRPVLSRHNGREVKTIGDAFLVEFPNALDAVRCAFDIQRATREFNMSLPEEKKIRLRVGVHLGDVVESQGDISGDAVNVASRIEPLAEEGGVCLTRQVYESTHSKLEMKMVSMGMKSLKNVAEPMEVYKMVMPWEKEHVEAAPRFDSKRVAVLPFANMSPDPNDEYFADGMTEELIDRLAQVKSLMVIARTSVMSFKKKEKTASEIARQLDVGTLVEGSVRKAGNRVRVTVQLISAEREEHLWSSHYDGSLDDVFAVQSEIAEKVAGELKVQLLLEEKRAIEKKPTEDTVAYTYLLQGIHLLQRGEEAPLRNALSLFEQALARDPRFARAQAGIAESYIWLFNWGYIPAQEGIDRGRAAATKALELDPDLAEAHYSLALVMFNADEYQGSMRELRRALELNPSLAVAYAQLADISTAFGDTQEMVRAAEKGYQLDPLSPRAMQWLGMAYFYTGRGEEAMEHWRKTLQLDPHRAYRNMFDYYVARGEYGEAEKAVKEMERLSPTNQYTLLNRGYLAALTGDEKTAREMIAKLDRGAGMGTTKFAGFIYYALGDIDRFFEYQFRAAEDHTLPVWLLRYSPLFEEARKDPRFGEVFRKAGLPDTLQS